MTRNPLILTSLALGSLAPPAVGGPELENVVDMMSQAGLDVSVMASAEDREDQLELFEDLRLTWGGGSALFKLAIVSPRGAGVEFYSQEVNLNLDQDERTLNSFATIIPGVEALRLLNGEWDQSCQALSPRTFSTMEHFSFPFPDGHELKGDILNFAARQFETDAGCVTEVTYYMRDLEIYAPAGGRILHVFEHDLNLTRDPDGTTNWSILAEGVTFSNQSKNLHQSPNGIKGRFMWSVDKNGHIATPYQKIPHLFLSLFDPSISH